MASLSFLLSTEVYRADPTTLIIVGVALILSVAAGAILGQRKNERPPIDDKPTTLSSRGSFTSRSLGRHKVAPIFAWAGGRIVTRKQRGGKGFAGGGEVSQDLYEEQGWHILGVGPLQALYSVYANGNPIWRGDVQRPLNGAPTEIDVSNKEGTFVIYWGTQDQDKNQDLAKGLGVDSRWPFLAYIFWKPKNLGPSNSWPTIEYECEFRPEKSTLSQSSNWVDEEVQLSSTPMLIKDTRNGEPGRSFIQVRDDQRAAILVGYDVQIAGQTAQSGAANGDYLVLSLELDDAVDRFFRWDEDPNNWTGTINSGNLVTSSAGAGAIRIQATNPAATAGIFEPVETFLRAVPGFDIEERFHVILAKSGGGSSEVVIEFFNQTNAARSAGAKLSLTNSSCTLVENRGASNVQIQPQAGGTFEIIITSLPGDGITLAETGDLRAVAIRFEAQPGGFNSDCTVSALRIRESRGTNVFLNETFASGTNALRDNEGTLTPYEVRDFDGANPAHVLHELLFAEWPHGLNLGQFGFFDIDSLEAVGVALSNSGEDVGANFTVPGTVKYEDMLERILLDIGCGVPTDILTGLVKFVLARTPSQVIEIPEDMVLDPIPEIETLHDDPMSEDIVYSFQDRRRNYRESTISLNDAGTASYTNVANVKRVGLSLATDLDEAEKIANRRELEDISKPTKFKLHLNRGARDICPGEVISVPSVTDERLRVLQSQTQTDNDGKVTLDVVVDLFGFTPPSSFVGGDSFGDGWQTNVGPVPPVADPLFRFWELPRVLTLNEPQIAVLRCRATNQTGPAQIWLSATNVVYNNVGDHGDPHLAGVTTEELSATDDWVNSGDSIEVEWDGPPDFESVEELSGDESSWAAGRQLCMLISPSGDEEILFVQGITVGDTGKARLKGIMRGRYGTGRKTFPVGSECYIFQNDVPLFRDPVTIIPDQDLYLKTQPRTSSSISIDSVTAFSKRLSGNWITPLPPVHLRVSGGVPYYSSGQDIDLLWNFRSSGGLIYRTGAGYQGAGAATGSHPPDGDFELLVKDPSQPSITITKTIAPAFGTTILNSEIVSAFGGEPVQLNFELRSQESGRKSDAAVLSIDLI